MSFETFNDIAQLGLGLLLGFVCSLFFLRRAND